MLNRPDTDIAEELSKFTSGRQFGTILPILLGSSRIGRVRWHRNTSGWLVTIPSAFPRLSRCQSPGPPHQRAIFIFGCLMRCFETGWR